MNPTKRQKLSELKERLDNLPVKFFEDSLIAKEIANITEKVKDNQTLKNLQKFNADLTKLNTELLKVRSDSEQGDEQIRVDLAPIQQAIRNLQKELKQGDANLLSEFEKRIRQIPQTPDLTEEVQILKEEFTKRIDAIPKDDDSALVADLDNLRQQLQSLVSSLADSEVKDNLEREEIDKKFAAIKLEINKRLANLGGGQASPQFFVGGNDPLKRYRDINLKAGSNVTLTFADNNTTKKAEITIAATGGTGSGIVRSINSISADTTAGSTAATDYVYLVSGTTTLTLPDATTNTNLYTVKNVGTGVVTIATTSAQTIDGNLTIIMPVQYTAVDLISDTANWNVT